MRMIVAFEKTERVRHVGHLDLMRTMQRALRRSGLPIRYSKGFNPHVVLSFASPLAVGVSGAEELMDVGLEEAVSETEFSVRIARAMPPSLPLLRVRAVDDQHPALMAQLRTAAYEAVGPRTVATESMAEAVMQLLARREIIALRKTKSGEKPCDIRPMLHTLTASMEDTASFLFRVSLTERETLKPDLLLRTLAQQAGVEAPAMGLRRLCLYGEKDQMPVRLMEL